MYKNYEFKSSDLTLKTSISTNESSEIALEEKKSERLPSSISSELAEASGSLLPDSFTLRNVGLQFSEDSKKEEKSSELDLELSKLDQLKSRFGELGALTIRFNIGQSQRVGLLQQIAREDYATNPVEKPAKGRDQADLFAIDSKASHVRTTTRLLEKFAHHPLGKGKVLNERAQPLIHVNSENLRGELGMWDTMHSGVLGTGINLAFQLKTQGFIYIIHPTGMDEKEHSEVSKELKSGLFEIITTQEGTTVKTHSGHVLETNSISTLKIDIDAKKTYQKNGIVVNSGKTTAPLGWILHKGGKVVPDDQTDHLIRTIRIAKGGFHGLTKDQQALLQSGLLQNNGFGLFTQNQAFNAMQTIFTSLEKEFSFDSSPLLPQKKLQSIYKEIGKQMMQTDLVEDFLTGALITEMIQSLRVTQPESERTSLPKRFTNSFKVTLNNAKAIAQTYDMKTKEGRSILKMHEDQPSRSPDSTLLDYRVNGDLINPALTNPKHAAALLSTGILVAEQMMLEQLLRDACKHGNNHPNAIALREILQSSSKEGELIYKQLIDMANRLQKNAKGPILGLQFPACEPIVAKLRSALNFDRPATISSSFISRMGYKQYDLVSAASELYSADEKTATLVLGKMRKDKNLEAGLRNLYLIGEKLQDLKSISARPESSRGINAGILPVIGILAPSLHTELAKRPSAPTFSSSNEPTDSQSILRTQADIEASALKEAHNLMKPSTAPAVTSENGSWEFFRKNRRAIAVAIVGVTTAVIGSASLLS